MERLGLGPDVFLDTNGKVGLNKKLIYARIAGYVPINTQVGRTLLKESSAFREPVCIQRIPILSMFI